MDYKKIFKSRSLRLKLLRMLSFVPDKPMLKLQYKMKTGRKLNLKNPTRFTEKLQWYKLYYRNPLMPQCVDKCDVREYVKSKGLEDILIPCLGVYDSPDQIDWEALPNRFVMKDTLGGGGCSVVIVKDKSKIDIEELKKTAASWVKLKAHGKSGGREWPYYSGKNHRILVEEYMEPDDEKIGLVDYKFTCFNGKPEWVYVISNRVLGGGAEFGIYDADYNKQDADRLDERHQVTPVAKPKTFELMKEISARLSADFPEARIDLYEIRGGVKFGEITFFDGSGYFTFKPDDFDEKMGEAWELPKKTK